MFSDEPDELSTPRGDTQPFEYTPDALSDDGTVLAARGLTAAGRKSDH